MACGELTGYDHRRAIIVAVTGPALSRSYPQAFHGKTHADCEVEGNFSRLTSCRMDELRRTAGPKELGLDI